MSASVAVWNGRLGAGVMLVGLSGQPDRRNRSKVRQILAEPPRQVNARGRGVPSQGQGLQISAKGVTEIGTGQGELHRRLQEAQLVAGVVPFPLELQGVHRALAP